MPPSKIKINLKNKKKNQKGGITPNIKKQKSNEFKWNRDTWKIIDRYFEQPNILSHNQLESYNEFIKVTVPNIIRNHSPIEEGKNWLDDHKCHEFIYQVEFVGEPEMSLPRNSEGTGVTGDLRPNEARLRGLSYTGNLYLNVVQRIKRFNLNTKSYDITNEKREDKISFKLQVMVHSEFCHLYNQNISTIRQSHDCQYDVGGYFIINGSEKIIISQQRPSDNKVHDYKQKEGSKYAEQVEIRSSIDQRFYPIRNNTVSLTQPHKDGEIDQYLRCTFPSVGKDLPLMVVFRALGIETDRQILELIVGGPIEYADEQMIQLILPSFEELLDPNITLSKPKNKGKNRVEKEKEKEKEDGETPKKKGQKVKIKITKQIDALRYISKNINVAYSLDYLNGGKKNLTDEEKEQNRIKYVQGSLDRDLLPHMGSDHYRKAAFLGYMTNVMLSCKLGHRDYDNRDHHGNKRLDLCGPKLKEKFQGSFGHLIKTIKKEIRNKLDDEHSKVISLHESLRKVISDCNIDAPLKRALATGDWTNNKNQKFSNTSSDLGVAQVLQRHSYLGSLSNVRRSKTPMEKTSNKITKPRKLGPTSEGYYCPHETPEGQQVGLVQNLSMMCSITIISGSLPIKHELEKMGYITLDKLDPLMINSSTKIFLNGEWLGNTGELMNDSGKYATAGQIHNRLKMIRRSGGFNPHTSFYRNYQDGELHIRTDGGRYTRPVYVVEKTPDKREWIPKIQKDWNKDIEQVTEEQIANLNGVAPKQVKIRSGKKVKDLSWKELVLYGYIEYLDPDETENCIIAANIHDLDQSNIEQPSSDGGFESSKTYWNYTHLLIHPYMSNGVVGQMIPFLNHQYGPRNCYQSSMGKQAMGVPFTNYNSRMDTMANILVNPERPLVTCKTYKYVNLDKLPHGQQCMIAVMCYGGYNQEDSLLINKGSVDRGLFHSLFFRTYSDEIKPVKRATSEKEEFTRPNPVNTKGLKTNADAYRHLNDNGLPKLGAFVDVNDVVIGKTIKLEEPIILKNGTKIIYNDISTQVKQGDDGYVDMIIPSPAETGYLSTIKDLNSDGNKFCKVRIVQNRKPVVGDKLASRMAQKGTISQLVPEEDMPMTDSGMTPDLVMNPHAFPSRMTIGQKLELLFGKLGALEGKMKDSTAFCQYDHNQVEEALKDYGFERYGNEVMYNGMTGEQIRADIFFGPTYYQRLKHMVKDKVHARTTGRVNNLTRQSVEGRTRDGGFRLGEMERDAIIGHGAARFMKESFMERADMYSMHVGKESQAPIIANPEKGLYVYNGQYLNQEDVAEIHVPYALKLFHQEITAMGLDVRLITEED